MDAGGGAKVAGLQDSGWAEGKGRVGWTGFWRLG